MQSETKIPPTIAEYATRMGISESTARRRIALGKLVAMPGVIEHSPGEWAVVTFVLGDGDDVPSRWRKLLGERTRQLRRGTYAFGQDGLKIVTRGGDLVVVPFPPTEARLAQALEA